jgi:hypothetical protein
MESVDINNQEVGNDFRPERVKAIRMPGGRIMDLEFKGKHAVVKRGECVSGIG